MIRLCAQCGVNELHGRADQVTCGRVCRQALARFRREIASRSRAIAPMRLGFGDPPYPDKAFLYRDHPDYGGEVDHRELVSRLQGYDGWALATDEPGLRSIQPYLVGVEHQIAVWVRGARPGVSRGPASSWEAVVYRPARSEPSRSPAVDSLVYTARARTTDPHRVIGAKPAAYWSWVFALLGAAPGDHFDDLYPGSGGGRLAWMAFEEKAHEAR